MSATTQDTRCPNCLGEHEIPEEPCLLGALVAVLVSSERLSPAVALERMRKANADHLWDDLGPIVDRLMAGEYDDTEEAA